VQNVDRSPCEAQELGVRVFASPFSAVHVTPDSGDRRDPAKDVDDIGTSDVAGMNDVIDARQTSSAWGLSRPCVSEITPILNII
jgi:hypothetical protein